MPFKNQTCYQVTWHLQETHIHSFDMSTILVCSFLVQCFIAFCFFLRVNNACMYFSFVFKFSRIRLKLSFWFFFISCNYSSIVLHQVKTHLFWMLFMLLSLFRFIIFFFNILMMNGTLMLYNCENKLSNDYKSIIIIFCFGFFVCLFFLFDQRSKGNINWETYSSICYAMPVSIKNITRPFDS